MKTCFVSMPYGIKSDPVTGVLIDFNIIYEELIMPAIMSTRYNLFRVEDVTDLADMQKSIIESVIACDIMIADLTTQNPNVMYELGMRHMAQRGLTIMICSAGTKIPANIANYRVISYELNPDGTVAEKSKLSFHQLLRYSIESDLEQTVTDSPVYQMFPGLKLIIPDELNVSESKRQTSRKIFKKKIVAYPNYSNKGPSISDLKEIQSSALKEPDEVDPIEFINLLKRYRDLSAFDSLVELTEAMPESMKKNPEVQQLYALALNRLGQKDKAILIMQQLVAQTGGDAETYGILGRIYKDKYEKSIQAKNSTEAMGYLTQAIDSYRAGFEKQPDDFYTGINVVNLLMLRNDLPSTAELEKILPRVREAIKTKMEDAVPDYWLYATALEVACIAKDWDEAKLQVTNALQQTPVPWMLATTINNLNFLFTVMNENEKSNLNEIVSMLKKATAPQGGLTHA